MPGHWHGGGGGGEGGGERGCGLCWNHRPLQTIGQLKLKDVFIVGTATLLPTTDNPATSNDRYFDGIYTLAFANIWQRCGMATYLLGLYFGKILLIPFM